MLKEDLNFTSSTDNHVPDCLENEVLSGDLKTKQSSQPQLPVYDPVLSSVHWAVMHVQH